MFSYQHHRFAHSLKDVLESLRRYSEDIDIFKQEIYSTPKDSNSYFFKHALLVLVVTIHKPPSYKNKLQRPPICSTCCWSNPMSNTSTQADKFLWSEPHNQDYSFSFKTSIRKFQNGHLQMPSILLYFPSILSVFSSLLCLFHIFSLLLCIAFRLW